MNVRELRERLQNVPDDAEVLVRCSDDEPLLVGAVVCAQPEYGCTDTLAFMIDASGVTEASAPPKPTAEQLESAARAEARAERECSLAFEGLLCGTRGTE